MKLRFNKKKFLAGSGVVLLLVGAGVAGVISSQIFNKPVVEEAKTSSGLSTQVDEAQNLRLNGKTDEANKKTDEIISQPGTSDDTKYMLYLQKGHASSDAKDYNAALDYYTQASKIKETSDVYTLIGETDYLLGDKAAARAAYEKAITLVDQTSPLAESEQKHLQQRIDIIDGKEATQ